MMMKMPTRDTLTIGTRGSDLALAQAHEVKDRLVAAFHDQALSIAVKVISTRGDRVQHRPLSEIGGKGLFTEEIEAQLLAGEIDLAVHSTKDMPTRLPEGLELSCFLEREAVEDAFISHSAANLGALPPRAIVGSASLRRQALIKRIRPDLEVINFRGNVQSRLRKLSDGEVDATLLAVAGLNRLNMQQVITSILPTNEFLPAPGQGAICVENRSDDTVMKAMLGKIHHGETASRLAAERAFLRTLDGSCRTPLAALAEMDGDRLCFRCMILSPDGQTVYEAQDDAPPNEAPQLGHELALQLKSRAGPGFFEGWN